LDALRSIVTALPAGFPIPIAVVVHVPPDRRSYLSEVLAARSAVRVKEAEDKEPLAPGTIYLAPPNYHLLIERKRRFSLSVDDLVHYSRPSIDVLFDSAAWAYGPALAGVLLTGANEDGARGMVSIRNAGGTTIVQAPETAEAPTMPEAALRLGRADQVFSPADIGAFLARLGRSPVTDTEVQ
jgi:two-component system chemotaxis response regulator CheB